MDEDDYYVDRYDCPKSTTTTAKINKNNNALDTATIITENISPPSSLDHVSDIASTLTKINDDEPYEYDDYLDQLYATTPSNGDDGHSEIVDTTTTINDTLSYEEYLRDIWKQLNVGHDGYLTVDELYRVCEHIGMNISNDQIIEQLFDRLDSDQDGRVSLTEFVDGLFQYIHHQSDSNHQNISSSSVPESPNHHHQSYNYQSTITNEISSSSPSIDDNRIQMNSIVPSSHAIVSHYQLLPPSSSSSSTILFNLLSTYSNFLTIKSDKDG